MSGGRLKSFEKRSLVLFTFMLEILSEGEAEELLNFFDKILMDSQFLLLETLPLLFVNTSIIYLFKDSSLPVSG